MRFTKPFWSGIEDGSITMAFRRWVRPTVVEGRAYRTGGGRIEVAEVVAVDEASITADHARRAGHASVDEVLGSLRPAQDRQGDDRRLYRITFRRLDEPDPREALADDDDLDDEAVAELTRRLDRYDAASTWGPWTRPTLALIAEHPGRRAPDLAAMVERETKPFKLDVRKLKNLGLTRSLRIGYELSPRGRAYLDHPHTP